MKIYIEFIIIIVLISIFLIGKLWIKKSKEKALKEYDISKDMSGELYQIQNGKKQPGEFFNARADGRTDKGIDKVSFDSVGHEQPERRELLPQTTISDAGKNSSLPGKNGPGIRERLFGRRKNRK
jgi:hypothetical protein